MICGKKIYENRQVALSAIHGMNNDYLTGFVDGNRKRRRGLKQPSKTYFCTACNGWHINTEGKKAHKKTGMTVQIDTKRPPDKMVIGKSQAPLIIHDPLKFKVK